MSHPASQARIETREQMLRAVCIEWLTADGSNLGIEVRRFFEQSNADLAAELIEDWPGNLYTFKELVEALAELRADQSWIPRP